MHFRRLASLILGAWLAGCVFMDMVATQNFHAVDRMLASPPAAAAKQIQEMGGPGQARVLLRYQASEINRLFFENWERVQLFLGFLLFMIFLFGSNSGKFSLFCSVAMLLIVVAERFAMTPFMIRLGRAIDFPPADAVSSQRSQFWALHTAYSATEMVKIAIGAALAVKLVLWAGRKSRVRDKIDLVDEPDHSHIDR